MIKSKLCTKCGILKPLADFHKQSASKDGFCCWCKVCGNKKANTWYQNNKARAKANQKACYQKNKEKVLLDAKAHYRKHKAEKKAYDLLYREKRKAERKAYKRLYYQTHKTEVDAHNRLYIKAHKAEKNAYYLKRYHNPKYKLSFLMSTKIRRSLKGGKDGHHWEKLVDFTLKDLIKQLKKTLPEGYTWNDYLNGADLHIDHKVPVHVFNITSYNCTDFKRCWALDNLQLLPATENIKKSNKLERHFQPSLTGF